MNDFLATTPFDIYELSLFRLVAQHGSFTKAAEIAGLTQSAITRQMQGMERRSFDGRRFGHLPPGFEGSRSIPNAQLR